MGRISRAMSHRVMLTLSCLVALMVLILIAGCSCSNGGTDAKTAQLDGGSLSYSGNELNVELEENATTGYLWTSSMEGEGLVAVEDRSVSAEEMKSDGESTMVGEGGVHLFSYEGKAVGQTVITLKYEQSWEQNPDDKTVILTVKTAEGGTIESVDAQ